MDQDLSISDGISHRSNLVVPQVDEDKSAERLCQPGGAVLQTMRPNRVAVDAVIRQTDERHG